MNAAMRILRRVSAVAAVSLIAISTLPGAAWAHGVGGREDLPIPLSTSMWVAVGVIVVSFVLLGSLWPHQRLQGGPGQRPIAGKWVSPLILVTRVLGVLFLGVVIVAGLIGQPRSTFSMSPFLVYVLMFLIVPFAGAVLGNVYSQANPWRTLTGLLRFPDRDLPARLGIWPAVLAFFAFTWFELVSVTGGEPRTLSLYAIAYSGWLVIWATRFGTDTAMLAADGFTTYNRLISAIAPIGRSADGTGWVWRGWLRALPVLPQWSGLTAFVLVMIGTVTFDGLSSTQRWLGWFGSVEAEIWFKTLAMIAITIIIGLAYYGASYAAAWMGGGEQSGRQVASSFAHTLVPIGLAYAFAHYFTLVLFEGQKLYITASDPFDLGWNLFGTAEWQVSYFVEWFRSEWTWWIQLAAIVVGHVTGVVLAHDRALAEFGDVKAVRSQWAMLGLMVLLTLLGLFILAEG